MMVCRVGNQSEGLRLVEESYGANFDCVISRGNTATIIRKAVSVPVIEVRVTMNDVWESLSRVPSLPSVIAAVGYRNTVYGIDYLNSVLPFSLEVFGIDSPDEIDGILDELDRRGIGLALCDTVVYRRAVERHFNACLLCSGEDSIRYSFEQVIFLSRTNSSMLMENQLLRRLVSVNSDSKVVVFDSHRQLYYSSLPEKDFIMSCLVERLPDFESRDRFRFARQQDGRAYRITARRVIVTGQAYYAYFLSWKNLSVRNDHRSIRFMDASAVRQAAESSSFAMAGLEGKYRQRIESAAANIAPVLIYGEIGTGKNEVAYLIYLSAEVSCDQLVVIDCTVMNSRAWDFLLDHSDSPLWDRDNTLFIKNIDALEDRQINQLISVLEEGDVHRRNRVVISCSANRGISSLSGIPVLKLIDRLKCRLINTVPLRTDPELTSSAAQHLWERVRPSGAGPLPPDILPQLIHFSWPQNLDQLRRVLEEAGQATGGDPLTQPVLARLLTAEDCLTSGETGSTANTTLDLTKPLSEINRDIARLVLIQNGGNQSAAARSLGISRTTLWNMLKK